MDFNQKKMAHFICNFYILGEFPQLFPKNVTLEIARILPNGEITLKSGRF